MDLVFKAKVYVPGVSSLGIRAITERGLNWFKVLIGHGRFRAFPNALILAARNNVVTRVGTTCLLTLEAEAFELPMPEVI